MKQTFYSNGKLLITGEYLVLDGAKALALPTKYGQNLVVEKGFGKSISWKSFDADGSVWFEDEILFESISNKKIFENNPVKTTLIEILHKAFVMQPDFLNSDGYHITTHLTFPKIWGLGTSSTLINNIAQWVGINAYELLWKSFGGSGYDIACAQNNSALLYQLIAQKPKIETIRFDPEFKSDLYFVYLNEKQSSKSAIASYKSKRKQLAPIMAKASEMTMQISKATNLKQFASELQKHENMMSGILEMPTVKTSRFADFEGTIKSLGAWGGDFVLVCSEKDPTAYFERKGYQTVIPYTEIIL